MDKQSGRNAWKRGKKGLFEKERYEDFFHLKLKHQKHRWILLYGDISRSGVKEDTGHRATQTGRWKMCMKLGTVIQCGVVQEKVKLCLLVCQNSCVIL